MGVQALPSQATIVSPAALLRHVSTSRSSTTSADKGAEKDDEHWNQDLLQTLLATIYKASTLYIALASASSRLYP